MATADAYPFERGFTEFERTVRAAQREIMLHVRLAIREGNLQRRDQQLLQLSRVLAVLDQLGAYTDPAARQMVQDAYDQGAARALTQITGLSIAAPEIPGAFAGVSLDAIRVLQDAINGNLDDSRRRIGRQVQDVYARAGRTAATRAILGIDGSPQSARRALVRDLLQDRQISRMVQNGGPGFVDTAGRKWTMERYASMAVRTVTREAVVQGAIDRMASHGIDLARVSWHGTSCQICKQFEGRLVSLSGDTREYEGEAVMSTGEVPPYHPNAIMAGARVESVGLVRGAVRARWHGPLVDLTTASGIRLAVGPNHPVLTSRGWLAAKLLRHGDHVIRRCGEQRMGASGRPAVGLEWPLRSQDDFDHRPPLVEQIFGALATTGLAARVPATAAHLHGDGNFCQGEIDVVRADCLLRREAPAAIGEPLGECVLMGAVMDTPQFARPRALCPHGHRIGRAIGRTLPNLDASGAEAPQQGRGADWPIGRDLLRARACEVAVDEIVEIRDIERHEGWAFDLETETQMYFADSLLVHNCAHSLQPVAVRIDAIRRQLAAT